MKLVSVMAEMLVVDSVGETAANRRWLTAWRVGRWLIGWLYVKTVDRLVGKLVDSKADNYTWSKRWLRGRLLTRFIRWLLRWL